MLNREQLAIIVAREGVCNMGMDTCKTCQIKERIRPKLCTFPLAFTIASELLGEEGDRKYPGTDNSGTCESIW